MPDLRLFSGAEQYERFPRYPDQFPTAVMPAATKPQPLPRGELVELPETFRTSGAMRSTEEFLATTRTAAFLVLVDGRVRHESYWLTGGPDVPWISWSVAKSFTSALIGCALDDGSIRDLDDPADRYAPELAGSAYAGVSIRHILQMSSGVAWNEDYNDPTSDIHPLVETLNGTGTHDAAVRGTHRDAEPGTQCRYASIDTQALGLVLARATGGTVAGYMHEKLCEPLGMTSDGYWLLDHEGREMTYGGLMLAPGDFARLGELYRRQGDWNGRQVLPAAWVAASTRPDGEHTRPGRPQIAGQTLPDGYGYQWWLTPGARGDYAAIGVYNQYVYVDPGRDAVVVRLAANPRYGTTADHSGDQDEASIKVMRAAVDHITG